jgi:hypothetical protein
LNITARVVSRPQPANAILLPGDPEAEGTMVVMAFRPPPPELPPPPGPTPLEGGDPAGGSLEGGFVEEGAPPPEPVKSPTYSRRFGEPAARLVTTFSVAVVVIAFTTCAGVASGFSPKYNAAAPATWGEAMDVPPSVAEAVFDVYQADITEDPGAKTSTTLP